MIPSLNPSMSTIAEKPQSLFPHRRSLLEAVKEEEDFLPLKGNGPDARECVLRTPSIQ
jgi:hypothetical protein